VPAGYWTLTNANGEQAIRVDLRQVGTLAITDPTVQRLVLSYETPVVERPLYRQGWSIASLPVTPPDNRLATLFPDAISAFAFDNGSYKQVSERSTGPAPKPLTRRQPARL